MSTIHWCQLHQLCTQKQQLNTNLFSYFLFSNISLRRVNTQTAVRIHISVAFELNADFLQSFLLIVNNLWYQFKNKSKYRIFRLSQINVNLLLISVEQSCHVTKTIHFHRFNYTSYVKPRTVFLEQWKEAFHFCIPSINDGAFETIT